MVSKGSWIQSVASNGAAKTTVVLEASIKWAWARVWHPYPKCQKLNLGARCSQLTNRETDCRGVENIGAIQEDYRKIMITMHSLSLLYVLARKVLFGAFGGAPGVMFVCARQFRDKLSLLQHAEES